MSTPLLFLICLQYVHGQLYLFLYFLVINAIQIILYVTNVNFDLIKVFYALNMFLICKYSNSKRYSKWDTFGQGVGRTADFVKGLWYQIC